MKRCITFRVEDVSLVRWGAWLWAEFQYPGHCLISFYLRVICYIRLSRIGTLFILTTSSTRVVFMALGEHIRCISTITYYRAEQAICEIVL